MWIAILAIALVVTAVTLALVNGQRLDERAIALAWMREASETKNELDKLRREFTELANNCSAEIEKAASYRKQLLEFRDGILEELEMHQDAIQDIDKVLS